MYVAGDNCIRPQTRNPLWRAYDNIVTFPRSPRTSEARDVHGECSRISSPYLMSVTWNPAGPVSFSTPSGREFLAGMTLFRRTDVFGRIRLFHLSEDSWPRVRIQQRNRARRKCFPSVTFRTRICNKLVDKFTTRWACPQAQSAQVSHGEKGGARGAGTVVRAALF